MIPPWFGMPTGMDKPDPIIWWLIGPVWGYLWALWAARVLSCVINTKPHYDEEPTWDE